MTDIKQLLPGNIYAALRNANAPTALNPYATIADLSAMAGWNLDGNTNGALKYIGTNDNFDFPIRTNGLEAARFQAGTGYMGINNTNPQAKLHVNGIDNSTNTRTLIVQAGGAATLVAFHNNGSLRVSGNLDLNVNSNVLGNFQISAQSTGAAGLAIDGAAFSQIRFFLLGTPAAAFQMISASDFRMYYEEFSIVRFSTNITQMYKNVAGQFLFSPLGTGIIPPDAPVTTVGVTNDNTALSFTAYNSDGFIILSARNDRRVGIKTTAPTADLNVAGSFVVDDRIDTINRLIRFSSTLIAIDWASFIMRDTSVGNSTSIDWGNRRLYRSTGNIQLTWNQDFVTINGESGVADLFGSGGNDLRIGGDPNGTNGKGFYLKAIDDIGTWRVGLQLLNNTGGKPHLSLQPAGLAGVGIGMSTAPLGLLHVYDTGGVGATIAVFGNFTNTNNYPYVWGLSNGGRLLVGAVSSDLSNTANWYHTIGKSAAEGSYHEFWNSTGIVHQIYTEPASSKVMFNAQFQNLDFEVRGDSITILYVDASTDRLGFNTTTPRTNIELFTNGNRFFLVGQMTGSPIDNYAIGLDDDDNFSFWKSSGAFGTATDRLGLIRRDSGTQTIQFRLLKTDGSDGVRLFAGGDSFINNGFALGIGTAAPSANALLDLQSTTRALKVTRVTTAEKNAITAEASMIVFDTDLAQFFGYDGATWNLLG